MKCLHLACKLEAWQDRKLRSHFCLEHAWRACTGVLLFSDAQWATYRKFEDFLVPQHCGFGKKAARSKDDWVLNFPFEWAAKRENTKGQLCPSWENTCWSCSRRIVSYAKRCGACQVKTNLLEPENRDTKAMCQHWRAEPSPGHLYLRNCTKMTPVGQLRQVKNGEIWCSSCFGYVLGLSKEVLERDGYCFLT